MAYHLLENEPAAIGIKRMVRDQIDSALEEIDDPDLDPHETVHQVRKRCKKIRAALRLARPQFEHIYDEENAWYRDAARKLSNIRDAQSQIECYDDLMDHFADQVDRRQFASVRAALTRRRNQIEHIDERLAEFRRAMIEGRRRVDSWPLKGESFDVLAGGLAKTYRRGRRTGREAYQEASPESFHEWRKRSKYHWYHMRMLRDIWGPVMRRRRNEVDRLGDYLGDDHDLAVLRTTVERNPDAFGETRDVQALFGLMERRRQELQIKARPLGNRIFAEKTGTFVDRMEAYWDAWREETRSKPALAPAPAAANSS